MPGMISLIEIVSGKNMVLREELVVIYPKLNKFAVRRTRDPDLAEDLVLEACKRMLERAETLDPSTNLVAYGITIIKNLINDSGRTQSRYSDEEVPEIADHADPGTSFEISQAMNTLGEECQKILEHFGMGYSYKEISEAFEVQMGTVMSRMSRCRSQFKMALEG
jgi:RNA polymerase sigma-70 factor (ECF subfamily)